MANECLRRTPTSTGNQRVWTWSGWIKLNNLASGGTSGSANLFRCTAGSSNDTAFRIEADDKLMWYVNGTSDGNLKSDRLLRDVGNWTHIMGVVNTTTSVSNDRVKIYVNGALVNKFSTESYPTINYVTSWNGLVAHTIGATSTNTEPFDGEMFDVFFIDGQALTPDVFGFYKVGKGYISVGSTQSTDFRPGQWVPKTPRVIKTAINNNGGFGVNGFYLPMNDSNNFGADFHGTPNSIIKLQENLPQPRCRIDGVGDYTGALRDDPFKQYLVLALPFVSGGLSSGFGDYSAAIKGSGSAKAGTVNGSISIASTASYYGSAFYTPGTSNYLSFVDSSDFDIGLSNQPFTWETWFNLTTTSTSTSLGVSRGGGLGGWNGTNGHQYTSFYYSADNRLYFQYWTGSTLVSLTSPASIITANQWNHMAVVYDTKSNLTMYVNGVAVAIQASTTFGKPSSSNITRVGVSAANDTVAAGYQQDLRIYKGVAKYTGGFDVPRPYTPVGIATWRAVPDTTANNFATLNGVVKPSKYTVSNGNLTFTNSTTNWTGWLEGTVGFSTGKFYWETRIDVSTDYHHIGIVGVGITHFNTTDTYRYGVSYQTDGRYYAENNNLSQFQNGVTQSKTVGDIVQVAVDMPNKRMWIGKNGTWFSGDPSNGSSPPFDSTVGFNYTHYVPFYDSYGSSGLSINFGQNPTFSGNTTAGTYTDSNNKGLFKYQPPSGFLALCEDNLPTPAIANPGRHFRTVLYTGDGLSGRSIVGIGFTPDLVWIKARTSAYNHRAFDSVRGAGKDNFLIPNSTAVEGASSDYYGGISSFNADGFSMVYGTGGSNIGINESGTNFVAWCWKAGAGTTSTNTNGSITSVVSVNQDAGFSIVSGSSGGSGVSSYDSYGHGLGKTPSFILVKNRDTVDYFYAYHKSLSTGSYLILGATNASAGAGSSVWGTSGVPTSSVITVRQASFSTAANQRLIFYCWAEIEGYSKFGSYIGNNSTDGPFCYCGFRPAWVMIKNISGSHNWEIYDSSMNPINPVGLTLLPNASDAQIDTTPRLDFLSNGFKWRNIGGSVNGSGNTIIFAAFAESPFSYSNSK